MQLGAAEQDHAFDLDAALGIDAEIIAEIDCYEREGFRRRYADLQLIEGRSGTYGEDEYNDNE